MALLQIDWSGIFTPQAPLILGVLRGSVIYFVLLILLRVTPRRTLGAIGIMDLLVVVLIADAAGMAMGDSDSMTDSIVVVVTLVGWSYILNALTYTFPAIERWVSPTALPIVRDGQLLRRNMRAEFITKDELIRQLHVKVIEDLSEIKKAASKPTAHSASPGTSAAAGLGRIVAPEVEVRETGAWLRPPPAWR